MMKIIVIITFVSYIIMNRIGKVDIERIMVSTFSMLSRNEMNVRKLLNKIHDDPDLIKRDLHNKAFGFDPYLAERVRVKQFRTMSNDEKGWSTLDKVLHPEVLRVLMSSYVILLTFYLHIKL